MKKNILASLLVTGIVLSGAGVAQAATVGNTNTNAVIEFGVGNIDGGDITKPDTEEEIITPVEPGGKTKGPLRISFAPHFMFTQGIVKADSAEFNAKVVGYTRNADTTTPKVTEYIPQFVQVVDERGLKDGAGWELSMSISDFKDPAGAVALTNSRVRIYDQKIFNTRMDAAETSATVTGMTKNAPNYLELAPNATSVSVMSVPNGKSTNSSKTSSVFNKDYTDASTYAADAENEGIKFMAAGKDIKEKDLKYKATITWTLTDTL